MILPGAVSSNFTEEIWFHSNSTDRYLYLLYVCDRIIIPLPNPGMFLLFQAGKRWNRLQHKAKRDLSHGATTSSMPRALRILTLTSSPDSGILCPQK